jgi:sensor histidine kinase YesM
MWISIYIILSIALLLALLSVVFFLEKRLKKEQQQRVLVEEKLRKLEQQTDSVHLASIESKLNPHLFKNILNSIQSHAYQTYYALDKMANVLDYILYESNKHFVTPQEEIDFALNLIEINKIKISPLFDLKVKTKLDETDPFYTQNVLAPLISIDLIENAFKHADLQSSNAFISIVLEFKNGLFVLTVSNKISSKTTLKKEKSGIGATTLEERLHILYKNHYTLERLSENDIYTAHLKIDLREQATQMPAS